MAISGKKVLVTGAAGLVGANLVPALLERGAEVRAAIHRKPPGTQVAGVDYQTCDLTRPEDCARVAAGQDWIFHLAARGASAAGFNRGNGLQFLENFFMDSQLLAAAQSGGVKKFVWLGSSTAYPPTGERPTVEEDLFRDEPFEKYYEVGWFKRFSEVLCRIYGTRINPKLSVAVLRPTSIYGPHDDFDLATCHVVPALVRKVLERWEPLEVWGTGNEERDFLFVEDVVEALLLAAEKVDGYGAFNLGAGQSCTIRQVVETLAALDGFTGARIQFDPSKPTTLPVRRVSIERAARELGWRPRTPLSQGLQRTLNWCRQRGIGKSH